MAGSWAVQTEKHDRHNGSSSPKVYKMETHSHDTPPARPVVVVILALAALYGVGIARGWSWLTESAGHEAAPAEHHQETLPDLEHGEERESGGHGSDSHATEATIPRWYAVLPFALLLGAIAVFPLLKWTAHWWEHNLNRLLLALGMGLLSLGYYYALHPSGGGEKVVHVLEHALLDEYIPFIVLLFSLYTISGGIRIWGDLRATPEMNSLFLIVGSVLASFIGTTGAAMLLIRPLLESNRERKIVQHTVVFFIFIVCNCGGCLLPLGDPPLFLGYLRGVPFLWTLWHLWFPWFLANTLLVGLYYLLDRFWYYARESPSDIRRDESLVRPLQIVGLWPNAALLLGVVLAVALLDPSKPIPGTAWRAWPFLREIVQLLLVAVSLACGVPSIRRENRFNYHAIIEVAALFIGIFISMQPALEILAAKGDSLGLDNAHEYFWLTGTLSSVLDNAPTYVVFFESAASDHRFAGQPFRELLLQTGESAQLANRYLVAISLGAVFMGAMTYIGNGPNFMVRAVAEQSGIVMPSFFGYTLGYALPILIPVFILVNLFIF